MIHDVTKILMGTTRSSAKDVSSEAANPATFKAGLAVRRKSDGGLQLNDDGTAALIGISLGADLADTTKTAVCRVGLGVPLRLREQPYASGEVEITSYANLLTGTPDELEIAGVTFVAQAGAAVLGEDTFRAATSDEATAISLAAQVNSNLVAKALVVATVEGAVVTITAKEAGEDGNAITLTYTDNGAEVGATVTGEGTLEGGELGLDTLAIGAAVSIDDTTGEAVDADDDAAVATSAIYVSGAITGVYPDGSTCQVALVDFPGGL